MSFARCRLLAGAPDADDHDILSWELRTVISRLLIANRGEIAVRIARTAHAMGISTVGVFSDPDADALHVDAVDVAVALGGSTPAESYLRIDAVVQAAVDQGCDAVHPGYGFLAENAGFARAVADAGLIWVGPTPEQIELLGDKIAAKRAAVQAGVPTSPAIEITAVDMAPGNVPDGLPMPALVKAAAGGGGRGMRIVRDRDQLPEAVVAASREAESAFGDGTVFVEPYIERGRHVEVQILGDAHGHVVHLGERECSIQRRNQKVLEETPSAGIDDATRTKLWEGALALARHVGYRNAGTVEFLVGPSDGEQPPTINFLEVNTRLQVEHPVTEAVTGLDLVELQLRVAAGEPLPITQGDVSFTGHAIEVRLVAEDPAQGWLPSTGTITGFAIGAPNNGGVTQRLPEREGVRVDSGFRAGSVVSADYDSLLAKVIAHAPTRTEAAQVLARALRSSVVTGVTTDAECLAAILAEGDFLAADTPTAYLDEHPDVLAAKGPTGDERVAQLIAAAVADERLARADDDVWGFAPSGWRNLRTHGARSVWHDAATGDDTAVELLVTGAGSYRVLVGDWPEPTDDGSLAPDERRTLDVFVPGGGLRDGGGLALIVDGVRRLLTVEHTGDAVTVVGPAGRTSWRRMPRFREHDASAAAGGPVAPLPGTVLSVHVASGDHVGDGQLLVVIEAMKMEHKITAPSGATVTEVKVAEGDRVDAGQVLVLLGDIEEDEET